MRKIVVRSGISDPSVGSEDRSSPCALPGPYTGTSMGEGPGKMPGWGGEEDQGSRIERIKDNED